LSHLISLVMVAPVPTCQKYYAAPQRCTMYACTASRCTRSAVQPFQLGASLLGSVWTSSKPVTSKIYAAIFTTNDREQQYCCLPLSGRIMAPNNTLVARQALRSYGSEVGERFPRGNCAYTLGQVLQQSTAVTSNDDRESVTAPWQRFFKTWKPENAKQ
jgi:hypothetical protein